MLSGLSAVRRRAIEAPFDAAQRSSDGGLLILREIDQRTALATRLAGCIADPRAPERIRHGLDEVKGRPPAPQANRTRNFLSFWTRLDVMDSVPFSF